MRSGQRQSSRCAPRAASSALAALLALACARCDLSIPSRPLDPPYLTCGELRPGLAVTCIDRDGERTLRDDAPRRLSLDAPTSISMAVPCAPTPIARPGTPAYELNGTGLDVRLDAACTLDEHTAGASFTQTLTLTTAGRRLCGTDGGGSAIEERLRWSGTLVLPAASAARAFEVRVRANASALLPESPGEANLPDTCQLTVGAAPGVGFLSGEHTLLVTTAPRGASLPVTLDCTHENQESKTLFSLGCIGYSGPDFVSPPAKTLRFVLEFRVSPAP